MQAIVLAGGMGTRLRPLTYTRPKPMIAVANRPAIAHIVEAAARAGFSEVLFTTNYMAEAIQAHCAAEAYPIPVRCISEDRPMGTAGAVKNVEAAITGPFTVIQGDSFSEIDLHALAAAHRTFGGLATIAVMPVDNPSEFGILELDAAGRIQRFLEKPKPDQCFSNLANTGCYVFEREVLAEIPAGTPYDFSFELFPTLLAAGRPLFGWRTDAYWVDLGRVASYLAGNAHCLSRLGRIEAAPDASVSPSAALHPPVLIGAGVSIEAGCEVGPFAALGSGTQLGAGARVTGAILYDGVAVGPGTVLEECVVAERARLGRDVAVGRHAVVGGDCRVEDGARILAGSRVGPFVTVERDSSVDGVLSPNLERIALSQAPLAGHPAFAGLDADLHRLCVHLLELGEAPAKSLAQLARIPFSRIHGLLHELGRRGLVAARGEAPKLFSLLYEDPNRIALRARQA